jgi:putative ABC transport system permease protein
VHATNPTRSQGGGGRPQGCSSNFLGTCVVQLAAAALAAFGLYGVLAFLVTRRRHEIGIRVALGATSANVLLLVVQRGLTLAGTGTALGLGGAVLASRFVEGMLFETNARDPGTFAGVTVLYLLVATAACLVPAWRVLRVDPVEAFRSD